MSERHEKMRFLTHMIGMAAEGLFGEGAGFALIVIAPERNADDTGDDLHMLLSANMEAPEVSGIMATLVADYNARGIVPDEVETITRNEIN